MEEPFTFVVHRLLESAALRARYSCQYFSGSAVITLFACTRKMNKKHKFNSFPNWNIIQYVGRFPCIFNQLTRRRF